MFESSFYSHQTATVLNKAKYGKDKTNIPNSHKAVANEVSGWKAKASALGIDFDATEYTLTVAKSEQGTSIYTPYIAAVAGEPTLMWGKVKQPLKDIQMDIDFVEQGKRVAATLYRGELEVEVNLMFPRGKQYDAAEVKRAYRQGKLGNILSQSFAKPKKLSELGIGEYTVIGYEAYEYLGQRKYNINVETIGMVSANSALVKELVHQPEITPDVPATLINYGVQGKTATGYDIVGVKLITQAAKELPEYSFDFDEEEVEELSFN